MQNKFKKIPYLLTLSVFVLLTACEREKTPPKDYEYYKTHLDEAQSMIEYCMQSKKEGKRLTENEKFSCKEASSAWMLKPIKPQEYEGFKGGTLDRK